MIENNNLKLTDKKFVVPTVPKTETRIVLNDWSQEVKKSNLSVAARSKVVNRSGSNYLSVNQENYGPCSYSGCPLPSSVHCKVDIDIEGNNRKWARKVGNGSWLPGYWEEGNFSSSQLSLWNLTLEDVDQSRRILPLLSNDSVYTINMIGLNLGR